MRAQTSQRYRVLHPLESGPGVRVFLVEDLWEEAARRVLTLIPGPFRVGDPETRAMEDLFNRRRGIRHPLLVEVLDVGFRGRQVGLITDFASMTVLTPPIVWPLERRIELALELTLLLRFLHHRGMLVGWLSPRKIFCDQRGIRTVNAVLPASSALTPGPLSFRYCAPEILEGAPPTPESDRYSLGMLLYLLLTGVEPYGDSDTATIKAKQAIALPTPPSHVNPQLTGGLEEILLPLIDKSPEKRSTLGAFIDALESVASTAVCHRPVQFAELVGRHLELTSLRKAVTTFSHTPFNSMLVTTGTTGVGKSFLTEQILITARLNDLVTIDLNHSRSDPAFGPFLRTFADPTALLPENRRTSEELLSLLRSQAGDRHVLLRATNLQWMEEGSLDMYRRILRQDSFRALIIGDCHYEESGFYWNALQKELLYRGQLTKIHLNPLTFQETEELLNKLVWPTPPLNITQLLFRICSGNPHYLLEIIQVLQEREDLLFGPGGWTWNDSICTHSLLTDAVTVARSIESRLSLLTPQERLILAYLAIADRELSLSFLCALLNTSSEEVEDSIDRLKRRSVVILSGTLKVPSISLSHGLLGHVVHRMLSDEETKDIHKRIVVVLEHLFSMEGVSVSDYLAHHVISSGLGGSRLRHIFDAVEFLKQQRLYRQACSLLERAFEQNLIESSNWSNFRNYIELLYLSGQMDVCITTLQRRQRIEAESDDQIFLLHLESKILAARGQHQKAAELLGVARSRVTHCTALENEILGDLLGCLSCMGQRKGARKIASEILRRLQIDAKSHATEKLFHALYLFYTFVESDLSSMPLRWEAKSLRIALQSESYFRTFGRVFNLSAHLIRLGKFSEAVRLMKYADYLTEQIENPEMNIYCQINRLLIRRKAGSHQATTAVLQEILRQNQKLNRNPHLEVEVQIELAKNACYQLLLTLAMERMDAIERLLASGQVSSSIADAHLLAGWMRILLGRPEEAIELAEKVRQQEIPREAGRSYLLSAQAFLSLQNLESAAAHAGAALARFSPSVPYYRTRARILQAEIALRGKTPGRARAYVEGALRLSRDHFYQPLLAKSLCLKAECLFRQEEPTRARAHALRAQQIASRVERPALRAEILLQLARIEERQGYGLQAEERRAEARELILSRQNLLAEQHREGFGKALAHLLHKPEAASPPQLPRTLVGIREFAASFRDGRRIEDFASSLLDCLRRQLKVAGVQLYIPGRDGVPRMAGSVGQCHLDGRELIQGNDPPGTRVRVLGRTTTLVAPLQGVDGVEGWVYVERTGGTLPEVDYDFLACIKAIAEIPLLDRERGSRVPLRKPHRDSTPQMVGEHPSMNSLRTEIARFAQTESTVLITGESGTGKELVAREIHRLSKRGDGPFLAVNCASFAADLIESQLFGHARGSFTGAVENRSGFFEAAGGGTLFLDEISSMPLSLQPKLLRVLQDKKVIRLGETGERTVDTRIVAATNQDLRQLAVRGDFRLDLYHRLNVLQVHVPPLRLRASDIPGLCRHFLGEIREEDGVDAVLSNSALEALRRYAFPGNVRELRNLLENLAHTAAHGIITLADVERRLEGNGGKNDLETDRRILAIVDDMVAGRADFWKMVRDPFMKRELSRRDVRRIISIGLEACGGSYRRLTEYFGMKPTDYKRFLNFLANHRCKVDFRAYRAGRSECP